MKIAFVALLGASLSFSTGAMAQVAAAGAGASAGANAGAAAGAFSGSNSGAASVLIQEAPKPDQTLTYRGEYTIKSAPGFVLGSPASGPCNGASGGIGGSGLGFSIGANFSKVDPECEVRELSRIAASNAAVAATMGAQDTAKALMDASLMLVLESDTYKRIAAAKREREQKRAELSAPAPQRVADARPAQASTRQESASVADICAHARAAEDTILGQRFSCDWVVKR